METFKNILQFIVYPSCVVLLTMALLAIATHLEDISDSLISMKNKK